VVDGSLPQALSTAISMLKGSNASSLMSKAFWYGFVVHLVGDFHQPLHTAALFSERFPAGDGGGNAFMVMVDGVQWNLHSFHDTVANLIPWSFPSRPIAQFPSNETTVENYAQSLIATEKFDYPSQPDVVDEKVWLAEGYELVANVSYRLPSGAMLPFNYSMTSQDPYVVTLQRVLLNRLALGGRRLKAVLEQIYAPSN
jgi:hypothetical protein